MLKLHGECWVITDTAAGNQRQALALAEQLPLPFRHLVVTPGAPWSWLSPRLTVGAIRGLPADQQRIFAPPWPSVAIGCGRAAALFTRKLRTLSDGRCYSVQILDPRIDASQWDLVIAPHHDRVHGNNVLPLLGSLNTVDDAWLADGRAAWRSLAELPSPRTGVLIGGPRRGIALDENYAQALSHALLDRQKHQGGSLLLLASQRTPAAVVELMRRQLKHLPGLVWAGPQDGANPYPGVLGYADRLVVTPDSVNMLSEACAVGCPVHTQVSSPLPARIGRFHQSLRGAGLLHDIDAPSPAAQTPLRETARIAALVGARIAAQQAAASTLDPENL